MFERCAIRDFKAITLIICEDSQVFDNTCNIVIGSQARRRDQRMISVEHWDQGSLVTLDGYFYQIFNFRHSLIEVFSH